MIAGRIANYAPAGSADLTPGGIEDELRRFHYDLAISGNRPAFAALAALVRVSQMLLGSDHPYRPLVESVTGLGNYGLSPAELRAVGRDNAIKLLPRLAPRG